MIVVFFFQAEDGIRATDRSRGLGDVYKRQDYKGIYPSPQSQGPTLSKAFWKEHKAQLSHDHVYSTRL